MAGTVHKCKHTHKIKNKNSPVQTADRGFGLSGCKSQTSLRFIIIAEHLRLHTYMYTHSLTWHRRRCKTHVSFLPGHSRRAETGFLARTPSSQDVSHASPDNRAEYTLRSLIPRTHTSVSLPNLMLTQKCLYSLCLLGQSDDVMYEA